jgi:hypothetical protein
MLVRSGGKRILFLSNSETFASGDIKRQYHQDVS